MLTMLELGAVSVAARLEHSKGQKMVWETRQENEKIKKLFKGQGHFGLGRK